jgi:hypothetical protein
MTLYPFRWKLGDEVRLAAKDNRELPLNGVVVALELRPEGAWASVKWLDPSGSYRRTVEPESSLRARHG